MKSSSMVGRTLPFGFNMASQDALDDAGGGHGK